MLSRVGDSTYWMGRYIERAENNARLLDVNVQMLLDFESRRDETERQFWGPILSTLEDTELFNELHGQFTAAAVLGPCRPDRCGGVLSATACGGLRCGP